MSTTRPDPQELLERVQRDERHASRGTLKIYIGMAAGVGKTYCMLSDASVELSRGVDIVAGYVEPHGRIETEKLALALERIPDALFEHRGITVKEFSVDAALARKPKVVLVDELAHTNAPGSRHEKRWQDVEELLQSGISVYTTVNVQHLASVSDVISTITGVDVSETVPDSFISKADEIELIDITPDDLIKRLKEGKVYGLDKVDQALNNFFRKGNLIALREIVLRLAAERVQEQLHIFRREHGVREVWPAAPRVLVCVSPHQMAGRVVRTASRLSKNLHADLIALSVDNLTVDSSRALVNQGLELAEALGATILRRTSNDVVQQIVDVAHEHNATIVVVGKPLRSRLREYLWGSIVDELIRTGKDLDVYVITDEPSASRVPFIPTSKPPSAAGVASALVITACSTGICFLCRPFLESSNLIMFYLLAVAFAASKLGRLEAIVTSVASVLAFDFFFVPPYFTFAVSNVEYLITFMVMLVIALMISSLTLRIKAQALVVAEREARTASLYDVSKRLAAASTVLEIAHVIKDKSYDLFQSEAVLFLPESGGGVSPAVPSASQFEKTSNESAVAHWVADRKERAGAATTTLSGVSATYIPLAFGSETAVLGVRREKRERNPEYDSLLDAFATQIGSAIARIQVQSESTSIQVQVERERLRNVLLSSVSHDLRTPLSAINGAAATLKARFLGSDPQAGELADSIIEESNRLTRIVRNVLDISKLESKAIVPKSDWQSMDEIIVAVIERTKPLLGTRQVLMKFPDEFPLVQADPNLLEQLFLNLFENEAKHTPSNTKIEVKIWATAQHAVVEITDNGPGLPRGEEQRVFEKLYRGTNANGQGFGLGLTICRAIMNLHGGSIEATNLLSGGAAFTLRFPLAAEQPEVILG